MTSKSQEVYRGRQKDRGKKEKPTPQVEAQISIENPVIPVTTFDLERQLHEYDVIIVALVERINLLEVEMDGLNIPASPAQHGHQLKEYSQIQSKLSRLSGAVNAGGNLDEDAHAVQILKENLTELVLQARAINTQLQISTEKSQADSLRQLMQKMTEVEARMKKLGILVYVTQEKTDQLAEIKRLRSLVGNLSQHVGDQTSLENSAVVENCTLLQNLIDLLLVKVVSIHASLDIQNIQDELKELERRVSLAKRADAKKIIAGTIAEKHRKLAGLRASQAEMFEQDPDSIIRQMAEEMLALDMSYEAFGIPRGLEERVTFPLSERVGVVTGADKDRKFIIISAYSRKPSGAQGYLLFERFVKDSSQFQKTRQLFDTMAKDPRNSNIVLRMIDYAPQTTEDSADGLLAQGITSLVGGSQSETSLPTNNQKKDKKRAGKRPPRNKRKNDRGPGKYSSRRR
jgi:hypothetical protein